MQLTVHPTVSNCHKLHQMSECPVRVILDWHIVTLMNINKTCNIFVFHVYFILTVQLMFSKDKADCNSTAFIKKSNLQNKLSLDLIEF